jgi:hypothetical protein
MFTCEFCGKQFEEKCQIQGHVNGTHRRKPKPNICGGCGVELTDANWWPSYRGRHRTCCSCANEKKKPYKEENRERTRAHLLKKRRQLKLEIIAAYGGECECCRESRAEFLSIDHINGGGRRHRKQLAEEGIGFYDWLKKQGFPQDEYRLLCYNCNLSLGKLGYCPHQSDRSMISEFMEDKQ